MSGEDLGAAVSVLACGGVAAVLALFVWSRRAAVAGTALAVLLAAVAVWNVTYAAELLSSTAQARLFWGGVKYVGIGTMVPAWVAFVLAYTGHGRWVRRPLLLGLAVEPLALLALLVAPATTELVRRLPPGAADDAVVEGGPLFWVHLAYAAVLMVGSAGLFVVSLVRRSRAYWLQAAALAAAALAPLAANLLFNLGPHRFRQLDLTPVVFTGSGAVLAWGLFQQRLLRLAPVARGVLVERMSDPVLVLDAYDHVVDANPASAWLLGAERARMTGRAAVDVLPDDLAPLLADSAEEVAEVRLGGQGPGARLFEVRASPLPGGRGKPGGRLLVLRDVTERAGLEQRLRELLAEQARVAEALAQSLRPRVLPVVPGLRLAACYRPAGAGQEIGGDFYDVFPVGDEWAFVLGDVSGKGAQAASATASARYTLRAVAPREPSPSQALVVLDGLLDGQLGEEVYLTAVHGRVHRCGAAACVRLSLGGHAQPLVVRADGTVEPVGVPGSAIGLTGAPDLTDVEVRLGSGDALVLTTDGVAEARADGVFFGEEALLACLRRHAGAEAQEIAQGLLDEVLTFQRGHAADDIAVLVLQVPPV